MVVREGGGTGRRGILFLWVLLSVPLLSLGPGREPRKSTGDPKLDGKIDQALKRGTERLVLWLPTLEGDRLALVLFAALEGGAEKGRDEVKAALGRMMEYRSDGVYGTGIQLMLFREHGGRRAKKALLLAAHRLLRWQKGSGGWSYGKRRFRADASNTQYALLGLRAAFEAGVSIPKETVRRAVDFLLRTKGKEGGFRYLPDEGGGGIRDTMTAGTLGSLAICRELAGREGLGKKREKALETALRQGVWWLARVFPENLTGRPPVMNTGYFLYALERAMVLLNLDRLGRTAWYAAGARYLVELQEEDGSWSGDPVATAFAVLFLARTFRPLSPVTRVSPEEMLLRLKGRAGRKEVDALAEKLLRRGWAAVPACLKVLRGPSRVQRRAAALALERITGIRTGFDPEGDPAESKNQEAARLWERWWMERRGRGKRP